MVLIPVSYEVKNSILVLPRIEMTIGRFLIF